MVKMSQAKTPAKTVKTVCVMCEEAFTRKSGGWNRYLNNEMELEMLKI